ncbi:MAG: hypothetical protein JXR13_11845 [Thalassovita sp.]
MSRKPWHIVKEDGAVTVARRLPVRFDFCAAADFPRCGSVKLAQQIRQDMWRALQSLQGFSPIVRVEINGGTMRVLAGGQVDKRYPRAQVIETVSTLLNSPSHRTRWVAYAGGQRNA